MVDPQISEPGSESPGYYITVEDASTQTVEEEFIFEEPTRDSSTQTPEDDLRVAEQFPASSENSEKSRKRKISNEQKITHGSDVCKLPRTDFPTFKESYSQNEELNVLNYLDNTKIINTGQNIESNENITQEEVEPCQLSHTNVFKVTNECSYYNTIPVPTHYRQNKSHSKFCLENHQNRYLLKQPSVDQKLCSGCRETVSKHVEVHEGKYVYRCCRCLFVNDNFNYLQMHIYNEHNKPFYCNECHLKYSVHGSHAPDQVCDMCKQNFGCKYQLEENCILVHKDYYERNCRNCQREFLEHFIFVRDLKKYECCFSECKYRCWTLYYLIQHSFRHNSLNLFKCEVCGNHYHQTNYLSRHLRKYHPLCGFCRKRFVNSYFLAEHPCGKLR